MVLFKNTAEISDGRLNPQSYINFSYFTSAAAIVLCTYMFITFSHVPRLRDLQKEKEQEADLNKVSLGYLKILVGIKDKNFRLWQ